MAKGWGVDTVIVHCDHCDGTVAVVVVWDKAFGGYLNAEITDPPAADLFTTDDGICRCSLTPADRDILIDRALDQPAPIP